jgi:hypothetical protein
MEQVAIMKHASTRMVFEHWNERRGDRSAPARADIDPIAIRRALGDTVMLAADFVDQLRFRLAGTRVCALFCREIKGEPFTALWSPESGTEIEGLLGAVTGEAVGAVAGVVGHTADGDSADLELLLLPLAHVGHARIRALGVLAPAVPPYWLGAKPLTQLELTTFRYIGPIPERFTRPRLVPALERGSARHNFVVYSGGRQAPPNGQAG